jgi:type II secretory pathway component PulM
MFKIIVWTFVLVMLYRFFTRFVLPVAKMTRTAKEQMQRMQQQMQDMQQQQQAQPKATTASRHIDGDYIEYEEVK